MGSSTFRSSPFIHNNSSVQKVMLAVIVALIPGIILQINYFGWGVLTNLLIAIVTAIFCEALIAWLRHIPIFFWLSDLSAVVTAMLLALALPSHLPAYLVILAVCFALIIGKHAYGGLGQNPFNPAMLGYVFLLVSFPAEMTSWPSVHGISPWLSLSSSNQALDIITAATPLDTMKTLHSQAMPINLNDNFWSDLNGWWQINLAYLLGGIYLLAKNIIRWHIPMTFLFGLTLISMIFYYVDPTFYAHPCFHLLSGATMLGAFFIATDPVTAATSQYGRLIYGALIGVLVYVIRTWAGYPDGIAFAVLLANLAAPTIDRFTKPRVFGH